MSASTIRQRIGAKSLSERLESARALLGGDAAVLSRISAHEQMAPAMRDVAFVFEAAPEKLPLKQQLFAALEDLTAPTMILASNSSAIPSTRIGEKLKHRDCVIGTHLWNPPHLVPLVASKFFTRRKAALLAAFLFAVF